MLAVLAILLGVCTVLALLTLMEPPRRAVTSSMPEPGVHCYGSESHGWRCVQGER